MNQPLVPIRVAAKRTDMSVECIRAWERRYQAITPQRSRGGRLFSEQDIQRLLLLKKAVDDGQSISQVAGLSDFDLSRLYNSEETWHPGEKGEVDFHDHLKRALVCVEHYDAHGADQILGKLAAFLNPKQFCFEVMIPLMKLVGTAWEKGDINVAQEHLASSVLRSLVATHLRNHLPRPPYIHMLIASPEGELHEFGMLCATILALATGIRPIYLGPNLPAEDMVHAFLATQAKALVIGLTPQKAFVQESLVQLHYLRRKLPQHCKIVVGGGSYDALAYETAKALEILYPADFVELEALFLNWAKAPTAQ